jgi:hypothetical protein
MSAGATHPAKEALMRSALLVSCAALLFACAPDPTAAPTVEQPLAPHPAVGRGGGTALSPPAPLLHESIAIGYGGGPVMLGTPDVYFIWYGDWSGNTATTILPDFMSHLGGSPYFNINTTYYDSAGRHVTGLVHYAGAVSDNYSYGRALTDNAVAGIVQRALSNGSLPIDENAVYFVITSADVTLSGFCGGYCGWHTNGNLLGYDIKYSFLGNPEQCPRSCAPYSNPGPNGNVGADGLASIMAHELEESITDPDLDAWQDSAGENADKCAWKFGAAYQTSSGAWANMQLGGHDYLVQENLNQSSGECALALDGVPPPPPSDGPQVTLLGPASGSVIHPGGPLDITADVTDSAALSSVIVNWMSPGATTPFTMSQNSAGHWELSTSLSSAAQRNTTRTVTVTATDADGKSATSSAITLYVR